MDMVELSEIRRPCSGETSNRGFTYYWSGMSNGHHVKGLAKSISSRLQPSFIELTLVGGIMQLRLKHSLRFMSVVAVYVPTEVCETEEKENSTPNSNLYRTSVSIVMCSSWAALMLSQSLKGLAKRYVLGPMVWCQE